MTKTTKRLLFVATSVAVVGLVLSAGYVSLGYSLRHLDLSGFAALFDSFIPIAKTAHGRGVPTCAPTWQPKGTSINDSERTMLYVETIIDEYRSTFGTLPDQIGDLDKVPSFANADRLNGLEFKRNCYIHVRAESYALGCGGSRPSAKALDDLLNKLGQTPGFFSLRGTEILYIPTPGCS